MKQHYQVASLALFISLLAGCGKKETDQPPVAPHQVPQAVPSINKQPAAPLTRDQIKYYSEHLDEARKTWNQCLQVPAADITPEIRARCIAAQTAWETQSYKPKDRK